MTRPVPRSTTPPPRRATRRYWATGAASVALVLATASAGCRRRNSTGVEVIPSSDSAPVRVATATAQARSLPQTLSVTGTLVPDQQSEVTPIVAGRVMEVLVERGSVVTAGQPLLRLRDVDYRSSLALANSSLQQARARLGIDGTGRFDPNTAPEVRAAHANMEIAEDGLRRAQQLAQSGSTSDQDLRRMTAQAAAAREQYQSALNSVRSSYFTLQGARTSLDQARRNVGDSIVRAPFSGEIAERRANVGEFVTTQRAVVTLVRTNPLRIELQIPQERIPFVERGQGVDVRVDAFPDRAFPATIRYISAAVRLDTRALVVEAVVPNDDQRLRPGLFATARISLGRTQPAVAVPASSVLTEAGSHRVFVVNAGRVQERVVVVAERGPQDWLITNGVQPGEQVATDHLDRLADGARVETGP